MAKIAYNYGSGSGDTFLSLGQKKIFSVFREEDRAELHRLYGGKQYYWSRSGLSGAGFLLPQENDLVRLPTYRTDTAHVDHGAAESVLGVTLAVPLSGRVLDLEGKMVVVLPPADLYGDDLKRMVFLPASAEVLMRLLSEGAECLEGEGWKQFYSSYHTPPRHVDEEGWATYRLTHFEPTQEWVTGQGYWWTFQERELRVQYAGEAPAPLHEYLANFAGVGKEWGEHPPVMSISKIDQAMGLQQLHGRWIRCGRFGLIREWWDQNPRHTEDETPVAHATGWTTVGTHFAYRRTHDDKMLYILERRRADLGERYAMRGLNIPEFVEYELEGNLAWFYLHGISAVIAEMEERLREKARADLQFALREEAYNRARGLEATRLLEVMKENADLRVCVSDSIETGNCQLGTAAFIARFGIHKDADGCTTLGALALHERATTMLADYQFRKVVDLVLQKHGVTLEAPVSHTSGVVRRVRRAAPLHDDEFVEVREDV